MKPVMMAAAASTAATDEHLVTAAREGSDEALETLYRRYRDRITAYVRGIVGDHARAEDLVQETFISAFRSLQATDREIIFKPWVYQIARNACIDQLRRLKRAQEVSIDSEDFKPSEEGRLSEVAPSTDAAVSQREDLEVLTQAFGGLPASQHEVLVLREFEGLSYAEIGNRMRISPAAVESMLFRARRGLKDEYEEISTGERCKRIQGVIAAVAEGLGASRDRRALVQHAQGCSACRHEAIAMGLGAFVATDRRSRIKAALHRAVALFPFPWLFRRKGPSDTSTGSASGLATRAQTALSNAGLAVGPAGEHAASFVPKAVAVLAAAAVIGTGGIAGQKSETSLASPAAPAVGPASGAGISARGIGLPLRSAGLLRAGASSGSPSNPAAPSLGTSPSPLGGAGPAGGLGLRAVPGALGAAPGESPGPLTLPGTGRLGPSRADEPVAPKLPSTRPSPLGDGFLPRLGEGSSGGGGGDPPSVSLPSVTPPLANPPALKMPPALAPRAPALPSAPSTPSVPATPSVPSLPSTSSGGSLDSVTNTVQGVRRATPPVTPALGL